MKIQTFVLIVTFCMKLVKSKPISVPLDNNYSYNNYYDNNSARRPNSYYNRLPPNSNQVAVDDIDSSNNDYDYEDQQTDKPVISSNNPQQSNYNNLFNSNFLLTENRVKKKRVRRPCIPIQNLGSSLFSNRLKRQINNSEGGKTFGFLGGVGYNPYIPPYGGYGGYGGYQDNVKPQYDAQNSQGSGQVQYGQPLYQPYGGYPCVPISYGYKPSIGGGLFNNRPYGGGGLFGGPGILGQGGLLDFGSPGPLSPAGVYQGSGSYPQTVIINRPPLFGNLPNYNRPQSGSGSGSYPQDSFTGGSNNQPFWGTVVDKLQEFVTGINPQQVFSSIGDSLQGIAQAVQNASPATSAANTIRQGYREFSSLLFR